MKNSSSSNRKLVEYNFIKDFESEQNLTYRFCIGCDLHFLGCRVYDVAAVVVVVVDIVDVDNVVVVVAAL